MTGRWGSLSHFCALLVLGIAGAAAPVRAAPDFPVATEIRVGGDEALTRFVVDLSRKIDLRAFTLADPYRVVIDIPQVAFQIAPKAIPHRERMTFIISSATLSEQAVQASTSLLYF